MICRERTAYLKKTELMFEDEIAVFKARSETLSEENLIRSHSMKSLKNEIEALQRDRDVVLMEIEELQRESEHEKATKCHLSEIVTKAHRELKFQRQELTAVRKETLIQVKLAAKIKDRMRVSRCPISLR
jgi:hypothetical protein